MIPVEAVEAAYEAWLAHKSTRSLDNAKDAIREALEAAAPHMLSHERGQTRLAQAMDEALAIHAEGGGHCDQCGTTYPCSTVKALALRETE